MSFLSWKKPVRNLFELVPIRRVEHELEKESGQVTLLVPRFRSRFAKRLLDGLSRTQQFNIRLDEIGSFVWLQIDGEASLMRIAELLRKQFGEQVDPVFERVALFARNLERDGLIDLKPAGVSRLP